MDLQPLELSREEFPKTWTTLQQGLADGVAPGFAAGFWSAADAGRYRRMVVGNRRLLPSVQPLLIDTPFDLASVAKVFATASLASALVEHGKLNWETPVAELLPGYADPEIRIRHLLSHTSGLVWWVPLWEQLRDHFAPRVLCDVAISEREAETRRRVLAIPRDRAIGEAAVYSDVGFWLLGYALEAAAGLPYAQAVEKWVWRPMGVRRAYYAPVDRDVQAGRVDTVAATEDSAWRGGILQGQVHDDNAWAMGGTAAHAGVFADIDDVMRLSASWLESFVSERVRAESWAEVHPPRESTRTLGWDLPSGDAPSLGRYFSRRSVGHLGFTGTSLWLDPEARMGVALLSNRVHPSRDNIAIRVFRGKFHDALAEDLQAIAKYGLPSGPHR